MIVLIDMSLMTFAYVRANYKAYMITSINFIIYLLHILRGLRFPILWIFDEWLKNLANLLEGI